jgi:hypothetical protein
MKKAFVVAALVLSLGVLVAGNANAQWFGCGTSFCPPMACAPVMCAPVCAPVCAPIMCAPVCAPVYCCPPVKAKKAAKAKDKKK